MLRLLRFQTNEEDGNWITALAAGGRQVMAVPLSPHPRPTLAVPGRVLGRYADVTHEV
jgi:hypothetical protein